MRVRSVGATAVLAAVAVTGLVSTSTSSAAPTPPSAVSAAVKVPSPTDFFGFQMGTEGKLASFPAMKSYLSLLAKKSARLDYEVVGTTTEGEQFPVVRMSSPRNLKRLDTILDINRRLSDPAVMAKEAQAAGVPRDTYAATLAAKSVPVYYIEGEIHSTEVGNAQALMDVAYRFASEDSDFTKKVLDNMVILMVPSQNPDGHNRVVDYFNKTAGTAYNRVFPDLYQKYVGHDDNRDWFLFTQKESQIRVRLEQKYRPAVQHYMHQAGLDSPRIWSPPWDEPMSPVLDPLTVASANSIGQEANRDLVAAGKKGASTDDAYGIMWNADVMGYSVFQGTTNWLTEIASVKDLWYTYTSDKILNPSIATMRSPLPYDKNTWSPQQIVDYAKVAVYSGLETVAGNPQEWLYRNMYQVNANSETYTGGPYAYVIPANQRDPYATYDMLKVFDFGKARIERATKAFTAGGKKYAKGSYILRTDQPLGRWIDQILRIDQYPDSARKCSACPLILPYSETTDNIALLFGVQVDAVKDAFTATTSQVAAVTPDAPAMPKAPRAKGAYVVSPTTYGLGKVITALEKAGVAAYRAQGQVPVLGRTLQPGALLVPASPTARTTLAAVSAETGLPVYALDRVPAVRAVALKAKTHVGLVRGANNMPGGWMMWMLEQFGADYDVVVADDYADLSKFDTIVLAPGVSTNTLTVGLDTTKYPAEFAWAKGVPDAPARLKAYVEAGGNLVALGTASDTAASALSLPVTNVVPTDRTTFTAPGALLKQSFNKAAPAAWGMPASWPVWFNNDRAYRVDGKAQVAASYPNEDDLLVSGYAKGSSALGGAANVLSMDVGKGQATLAGGHITFRTWPRAEWTIVTNAMYNGAGTPLTAAQLRARFS